MDQDHIKELAKRLEQRLLELEDAANSNEASRETVTLDQQAVGRLSRMDALQGQAMALETDRRRKAEITRIKAALQLVTEDEYGYCQSCGEEISPKRLELDPSLMTCIGCAG